MKKNRKNAGFTMVELMVVVAILTILMGVAFVNVIAYQRKLKAKEADSAAKELFIAAQNHLTAADALGQLEGYKASPAEPAVGKSDGSDDYYVVYPGSYTMLDVMLPFGSIDDTVRTGGSYIIHYNLKLATVLDVYYSDASDKHYGATLGDGSYFSYNGSNGLKENVRGDEKREDRKNYHGKVVGWYGGANVGSYSDYLAEPTIKVTNGEKLKVEVSALKAKTGESLENRVGPSLSLIITGVSSGAMKEIKLVEGGTPVVTTTNSDSVHVRFPITNNVGAVVTGYSVVLDNLSTSGKAFQSVVAETETDLGALKKVGEGTEAHGFYPGENLSIRAVAFDNNKLSNIAESGVVTVNSLFGSLKQEDNSVTISAFRHLENLDGCYSGLDWKHLEGSGINSSASITARQVTDLDWTAANTPPASLGYSYRPVIPRRIRTSTDSDPADTVSLPLVYDAGEVKVYDAGVLKEKKLVSHIIRNLTIENTAAAGLFGTLISGSSVSNLDLVNINIPEGTGGKQTAAKAGALAAVATADLKNVRVYNDINGLTDDRGSPLTDDSSFSITGSGDVGGLVGQFTGSADGCAAAVYVKSTGGSAGGLFGTASAPDAKIIKNSYSGGHTSGGKYNEVKKNTPSGGKTSVTFEVQAATTGKPLMNVTGTTAGGLIGTLSSGTVEHCYSTCSVNGTGTAGGFVGSTGGTINSSYCTGLVALNKLACTRTRAESGADPQPVGLFAGEKTGGDIATTGTNASHYMEIVNYIDPNAFKEDDTKEVIPAVGKGGGSVTVTAFDASADAYNNFIGHTPVPAVPYDKALLTKAETIENVPQYSLKPVPYTCTIGIDTYKVAQHIGDWPIYETYVVNN